MAQVYWQIHTLLVESCVFTASGPAMSMPTTENAGALLTLDAGRGGAGGRG
jgi:hypothetical protein